MTSPASAGTRRLAWALAGAVALHLLALWLLRDALGPRQAPATGHTRPSMVWVAPAPRAAIAAAPAAPPRTRPSRRAVEGARPTTHRPPPDTPARHAPPGMEPPSPEPAAPSGTAPPTDGHGPGSAAAQFLDAPHSQRALAQAARTATPAAQAMQALPHGGPTTQEQLAHGLQQARHGDCAKGEFKGGGMGLLSLPALAAAMARGECSR